MNYQILVTFFCCMASSNMMLDGAISQGAGIGQPLTSPSTTGQLNTVDLPVEKVGIQGNWAKKKEWLLKSHEAYNQIIDLTMQLEGIRKKFNDQYDQIDAKLDEFYKKNGFEQGKLRGIFTGVTKYLEEKKQREIQTIESRRQTSDRIELGMQIEAISQKILVQNRALDQLNTDIQSIEELDHSLTDRLRKMDEQINSLINIADQAKRVVNELWHVIDDKIARTTYYSVKDNYLETVKNGVDYLSNTLFQDFAGKIATLQSQMNKVNQAITQQESEGLIIKDRALRLTAIKEKQKADEDAALKADEERKRLEAEKIKNTPKEISFLGTIWQGISNFLHNILFMITNLFSQNTPTPKI